MDAKALQDDLQSLGFTSSLAKPEMGKEVGRRRATHKMKEWNESWWLVGEVKKPRRVEVG